MSPTNFRWERTKVSGQVVGSFSKGPNHDPLGTPIGPPAISMLDMARPDLSKGLMQSALETGHVQVVFHKGLVAILDDDGNGSNVMVSVKDLQTGLLEEQTASFLMTKESLALAVDTKELTENTKQELLSEQYISFHYDRAWAGPRPLAYSIARAAIYTIHQRLRKAVWPEIWATTWGSFQEHTFGPECTKT